MCQNVFFFFFLQVNAVNLPFNPIAETRKAEKKQLVRVASLPEQVFYLVSSPDVQRPVVREGPVPAPLQASHQIPAGTIHIS